MALKKSISPDKTMMKPSISLLTSVFLIAGLFLSSALMATSVLPLSFDQLVTDADRVFQGRCIENRQALDPDLNIQVTYTTFEIEESLKGVLQNPLTIKQAGGSQQGGRLLIQGVPEFTVGSEYVVFLYGTSSQGFSSPVGLQQGQFTVIQNAQGQPQVTNGRDLKETMSSLPSGAKPRSLSAANGTSAPMTQMGLDDFKTVIKQRVGVSP